MLMKNINLGTRRKLLKTLFLINFLALSSIILIPYDLTSESEQLNLLNNLNNLAPAPFISLDCDNDSFIILAVKKTHRLYVLSYQDNSIRVEQSYLCSTGKIIGDKQKNGDLKTPEGIYFIRRKINSSELLPKYGAGAYVLDYPNHIDLIDNKNGYGIWIHGTNDPQRLNLSNNTLGCIIVKNEDFIALSKYIELNKTPFIIVDEIQYRNIEHINSDKKEVFNFLEKWEKSWESKNIDEYINLYSRKLIFKQMNFHRFRKYKKRLFKKYSWIELNLSNIQIYRKSKYIIVNFEQKYSTDIFSDFGIKQLSIIRENNFFKIIDEKWSEIIE